MELILMIISTSALPTLRIKNRFDSIDMVFLDGEANFLPWSSKWEKFAKLFQMCKLTNKCLFAAGFGISMQVYHWATNYEKINVINGNSKGGLLDDIHSIDIKYAKRWGVNDVFLDNATGDYYMYK